MIFMQITLPIVLHGTTYVHVNYDMYYTTDHFSMNKNYLQIFSGKMQNFFFISVYTCLYIHVYIYIFVLFLERKLRKKNLSVENTKR